MTKADHPRRSLSIYVCGCQRYYSAPAPLPMDAVWCNIHGETTIVANSGYTTKCDTCRYVRHYNELRLNAARAYMQHVIKNPSHTVTLNYNEQILCNNIVTSPLFNLDLLEGV